MHNHSQRRSGSVLITSIIFGFALMAAVAGYVYLTTQSMRMANRTFHLNSAMNLAEAGIEEGLYALNTYKPYGYSAPVASAYDNWSTGDYDGDGVEDAKRTFSYFLSNQGTTGQFTVIVSNRLLANEKANPPKIYVKALSSVVNEGTIEKAVWANTRRRSLNANALVSRRGIRFDGNFASVDSYDANLGPYEYDTGTLGVKEMAEDVSGPAGVGVPDGTVNRFGNATVASASVGVNLGNADVWGYVATNGSNPNMGPNGTVAELGSSQGTVDPERVSTDFQANFPQPEIPPSETSPLSVLPAATTNPTTGDPEFVLGNPEASLPVIYAIAGNFSLNGNEKLRIIGPVRIITAGNITSNGPNNQIIIDNGDLDGDGIKNFDNIFANAMMTRLSNDNLPPLQIWIGGNLTVGSGGIVNPSTTPASLQIYGTAPVPSGSSGTQSITIRGSGGAGTGSLAAAVYAPNADLTINGDEHVFGAFVANSIRVTGNPQFHYDESLANNGTGKYALSLWRELLTPAQRSAYSW